MTAILIIGGRGFIGRHLAAALVAAGCRVTAPDRNGLDLVGEDVASLAAKLAGYDVVVNAAGLVRSRGADCMTSVHVDGVARLVHACRLARTPRLIHLSALGAAPGGPTEYQRTKGRAESFLAGTDGLEWCVLRPSVVIGRGGASTALFSAIAAFPTLLRLGRGDWKVQPVHIDDLAALVARLALWTGPPPRRLDVVGPEPMSTDALTSTLRDWLGLPARRFLTIPEPLLAVAVWVGERFSSAPISRETLAMLKAGNTADPSAFAAALGRSPQTLPQALSRHPAADADRLQARLYFLRPVLRWSLAWLWIVTGLLSLGLHPLADSYRLLTLAGLNGPLADAALFGGAGVDLLLGGLLLIRWRPTAVGGAMLASMAAFTAVAAGLPAEYWAHPFAPLAKNLPIAAATLAMIAMEA